MSKDEPPQRDPWEVSDSPYASAEWRAHWYGRADAPTNAEVVGPYGRTLTGLRAKGKALPKTKNHRRGSEIVVNPEAVELRAAERARSRRLPEA